MAQERTESPTRGFCASMAGCVFCACSVLVYRIMSPWDGWKVDTRHKTQSNNVYLETLFFDYIAQRTNY